MSNSRSSRRARGAVIDRNYRAELNVPRCPECGERGRHKQGVPHDFIREYVDSNEYKRLVASGVSSDDALEKATVYVACSRAVKGARDPGRTRKMTTYSRDAYLQRDSLPSTAFAIPERRAWPIHNLRHARIALRYMREGKGDRKDYPRIRQALAKRWPGVTEDRGTSRDIQVIIKDSGSSGGSKRQRYNPAKARRKKFKGTFKRTRKGPSFAEKMRAKYGDRGTSMSTETQRDPSKGCVITREKLYRRNSRFPWQWLYTVTGPDGQEYKGEGIDWARGIAKRKAEGGPVVEAWTATETTWGGKKPSRDFADDIRTMSLQALGRLLVKAARAGNDHMAHLIEKEIDRRGRPALTGKRY